jgi:hypothetical protein
MKIGSILTVGLALLAAGIVSRTLGLDRMTLIS